MEIKNYISFEPSKEPLYTNQEQDIIYLFKENKLMVYKKDEYYIVPTREDIEKYNPEIELLQCLGAYKKRNCYSGQINELLCDKYEFIDLRTYSQNITEEEFLVSAKAILLLNYMRDNKRCGICGASTIFKVSGNDRAIICTNCNHMIWPKTAPAIIVAVTRGNELLLAHNKMFKEGIYSILAGFVELGETFEDCVRREVYEETGIKVHNIKYFGSQPWPFPNSMMIGFTAEYLEGEIKVDNEEIVDAKWFKREDIPGIYKKSISISTELIEWFLNK